MFASNRVITKSQFYESRTTLHFISIRAKCRLSLERARKPERYESPRSYFYLHRSIATGSRRTGLTLYHKSIASCIQISHHKQPSFLTRHRYNLWGGRTSRSKICVTFRNAKHKRSPKVQHATRTCTSETHHTMTMLPAEPSTGVTRFFEQPILRLEF